MIDEKIGYNFKNREMLKMALTHPSKSKENYQRLEFLGDSILNFLVAEFLFLHCQKDEGKLTVLRSHFVSEDHLSECFDELDLGSEVVVGKSLNEITNAIKGDVVESIIATIYLDGGIEQARNFIVEKLHISDFENAKDDNFKSQLQELVQANFKCSMKYETIKTESNLFEAKFFMDDEVIAVGYGKDKTKAEQNCAYVALSKLFEE